MRLFGNMASHGLVLAVVASLAGLLVPIPLVALGLLVGVIQAYIFTILATTYVGAAVSAHEQAAKKGEPRGAPGGSGAAPGKEVAP